jgi:hypothetical protein
MLKYLNQYLKIVLKELNTTIFYDSWIETSDLKEACVGQSAFCRLYFMECVHSQLPFGRGGVIEDLKPGRRCVWCCEKHPNKCHTTINKSPEAASVVQQVYKVLSDIENTVERTQHGELSKLLAYADDFILLRDNIDTVNKKKETLTDNSKEFGLEINVEETKYMLLSCHQNVGQNQDIKIAN